MAGVKGFHVLADLYGCSREKLERASVLRKILTRAAQEAGFNIVGKRFYQFKPSGATGIILISTSHISAHSWPEFNFVALDIYSCGGKAKAKKAAEFLLETFKPKRAKVREIERFR